MEATPFELTPEQKGMLASLSRETGKSIPALIAKALEELQEHEHSDQAHGERHAGQEPHPPHVHAKPINPSGKISRSQLPHSR